MITITPAKTNIKMGIRELGVFSVILIIILPYVIFFYLEDETRKEIKLRLLEEQRERQLASTVEITDHIGSDLTLISSFLDGLANSKYLQDGHFYNKEVKELADEKYSQMNTIVDKLFILNKDDVVVYGASNSSNSLPPVGNDLSFRPWVIETRNKLQPVFSDGFESGGEYRVSVTNPIINRETRQYLGLVGVSVPTVRFFEHYGNVHDINSQFLVAFDKKGILMAVGASQSLLGQDFFGDTVQEFVNYNPALKSHTLKMLEGNSGYAVYDYGRGERLMTYQQIYVAGKPTYFLEVVTPTATIYSQIDPILSREIGKLALFLAGAIAASAVLVAFLIHWNSSLKKEVTKRTIDLQESNKLLADANEQLKQREESHKDFINIAAHEMRTPIQPMLGMSYMIKEKLEDLDKQEVGADPITFPSQPDPNHILKSTTQIMNMLDVIARNAKRLDNLSNSLLDVSRIENNLLKLDKERVDLNDKIKSIVADANSTIIRTNKDIEIIFEPSRESITVEADKIRLFEAISNIIQNAIKFTGKGGTITVRSEKHEGCVIVSIKDTGSGIDQKIMPRLFTKFSTNSEKGMGLGLYIAKNVVEAHGGRIWAENNPDGKGATFAFMLPLAA